MVEPTWRSESLTARAWRRRGRRLPWLRRDAVASAAALAALFNATACGTDGGAGGADDPAATSEVPTTTLAPTTVATAPATTPTTAAPTTARAPVPATSTTRRPATTAAPLTAPPTTVPAPATTTSTLMEGCYVQPDGSTACVVPGRPLRRHRTRGLLLPGVAPGRSADAESRAEYASVASFGELALRLLAVGAPAHLVAACHQAALDEIRHAQVCTSLAGLPPAPFGAMPGLLGRRLGGWRRSRTVQLQRIAVESFRDGWVNEGAAADHLRHRAGRAASAEEQAQLLSMAADEQRHADLARAVVTWCFEQEPGPVGRALGRAAPLATAA